MFDLALKHTTDEIDRRLRNPFWGGLILGWLTWNWRVWYLTFFVSEDLVGNKIAEIQRMYEYFGWHALLGIILNWLIIPMGISYLVIFHFPKITDKFLIKQKKNKDEEDRILRASLKSEEENAKAITELLDAERKKFESEKEKIRAEMKADMEKRALVWSQEQIKKNKEESGKESWDEDYLKLTKKYPNLIDEITDILYNHDGWAGNSPEFGKISEVNELTITSKNSSGSSIHSLTEKGKYFLKKHSLS